MMATDLQGNLKLRALRSIYLAGSRRQRADPALLRRSRAAGADLNEAGGWLPDPASVRGPLRGLLDAFVAFASGAVFSPIGNHEHAHGGQW
jgi:hypothetical protein